MGSLAIGIYLGSTGLGGEGVPPPEPGETYQHLLLALMWLV